MLTDWRVPGEEAWFEAVNGYENPALESLYVAASSREFGVLCGAVMIAWLLVRLRRRAGWALGAFGVTVALVDGVGSRVLKPWVGRMRPSFALPHDLVRVLAPASNSGSMPSLHAANAFAVATVMALALPNAGWVTYPLAAFIALSRVGVGVHWPSDIAAGALYGVCVGALVTWPVRAKMWVPQRVNRSTVG